MVGKRLVRFVALSMVTAVSVWSLGRADLSARTSIQFVPLYNHVPHAHLAQANDIGRMPAETELPLTISLKLQNQDELTTLLGRLYDVNDPMYGKFLSTAEFSSRYHPAAADVTKITKYFTDQGLKFKEQVGNTIRLSGSVHAIEHALSIELHEYQTADFTGHVSKNFAPAQDPVVESSIAQHIIGIHGLHNFSRRTPHLQVLKDNTGIGTGAGGGLTPANMKSVFSIPSTATATGQNMALIELDGYTASDITAYETQYGIAGAPALQNVTVDGGSGALGDGAIEVTLDIEMMVAIAPTATKIYVYEGPNTDQGLLDLYAKVAADNTSKQISTSWGGPESTFTSTYLDSENTSFMQLAAQGQSFFAAAGDSGAYDDTTHTTTLNVDDPGAQPYVTAVGGTTLAVTAGPVYRSESSWGLPGSGTTYQGGGGGISKFWAQPTYQKNMGTTANKGSQTMRMVPDVSLNANPNTGYTIYYTDSKAGFGAYVVGGTSCAAPIYAAFAALVNSSLVTGGHSTLGFMNPALYQLAMSANSAQYFHDIADNSTNLFYPAVKGYDLSTGIGSMIGSGLYNYLTTPAAIPTTPTGLTATPHNTVVTLTWSPVANALTYSVSRSTAMAGPFTVVAQNVSSTSYTDTGLSNGTTYYYYISASDIAGASANTNVLSAQPTLMAPEAPTDLSLSTL